jgi:signal transduction histidine kinase/AmiR/NasT family two-component response regulator
MNRTPGGSALPPTTHEHEPHHGSDPGTRDTYHLVGDRLWLQAVLLALILLVVHVLASPLPGWLWLAVLGAPSVALLYSLRRRTSPGVAWVLMFACLPLVLLAAGLAGPQSEVQWLFFSNMVAFYLAFEERFPRAQAWGVAINAAAFVTSALLEWNGAWTGALPGDSQRGLALLVRLAVLIDLLWVMRHYLRHERRFRRVMRHDRDDGWRAAAERETFIADMCHEIRTPLVALTHVHEVLLSSLPDPKDRALVEQAIRSGDHLVDVLNDALDLARIDAGRLELDSRAFCLRELVEETVALWRVITHGRPITVDANVQLLRTVRRGDRRRLKQVLMNLLSNAVKFTEQGRISIVVSGEGELVQLRVVDDGVGMSETQIAKVFEAFTQADRSTGSRYGGTGLGLAISQRLVHAFGGQLQVASALGAGSEFRFEIPLPHAELVTQEPEPPTMDVDTIPLRVLLAEDNLVNQLVIRRTLEQLGHEVEVVGDGRSAVERWRASRPDVVLMDVEMPAMDGLTATRRIRSLEPVGQHEVAVLALTAHAMPAEVEQCLRSGMNGHLAKPVRPKDLQRAMITAVRASRAKVKTRDELSVISHPG